MYSVALVLESAFAGAPRPARIEDFKAVSSSVMEMVAK